MSIKSKVLLSIRSKVLAAVAMLTIVGGVVAVGAPSVSAATPQCGSRCIDIFSREFGTPAQPNYVESVYKGIAKAGQPTILAPISNSNPAGDFIVPRAGLVSDFFKAGMVSAAVNSHYGALRALQVEYAPFGVGTGLCSGLATPAHQNEGLTLQPCSVPGTTVFIIDTADSPAKGYFPLINGSTTDFVHPFVMTMLGEANPSDTPLAQILIRHLTFISNGNEHIVPDRQLWSAVFGV
jgi:hypothetical protein